MRLNGSLTGCSHAKRLRERMTPTEIGLRLALRGNEVGRRFKRRHAAGQYVLVFCCVPARLAIKVDGESHNHGYRPERDATRDASLVSQNIHVLRYPAREMLVNLDDAVRQITAVTLQRRITIEN